MSHLLVNAGPGCGKSHSIADAYIYYRSNNKQLWLDRFTHTEEQVAIYKWCAEYLPPGNKAVYMAYNTTTRDDLKKKVHKDTSVATIHGWGYTILNKKYGYIPVIANRGQILVEKHTGKSFNSLSDKFLWLSTIRYLEHLKEELLPPTEDNFYLIQSKYSDLAAFPVHSNMVEQAEMLLKSMKRIDRKIGIEYIDQIWNTLFELKQPPYEIGFVDECQDLSPAKLLLAQSLCENLLFVGDSNQAINAFSGADPYSFDKIKSEVSLVNTATSCPTNELELKLSFRLPPNIGIKLNNFRPTAKIRTTPGKLEGIEADIHWSQLVPFLQQTIQDSPLIVCRYNAPLARVAITCLKNNIPCKALGDTLANTLISTVRNRNADNKIDLLRKLTQYEERLLNNGRMQPIAREALQDRFDCIRYVFEDCETIADFEATIKAMLKPHKDEKHILCSTIHKAKGLESKVVAILFPPVQSPRAATTEQKLQEDNLWFVAVSRTLRDLYQIVQD